PRVRDRRAEYRERRFPDGLQPVHARRAKTVAGRRSRHVLLPGAQLQASTRRDRESAAAQARGVCDVHGFHVLRFARDEPGMGKKAPAMFKVLPPEGIAQWTLTGMVREKPLPLTAYL